MQIGHVIAAIIGMVFIAMLLLAIITRGRWRPDFDVPPPQNVGTPSDSSGNVLREGPAGSIDLKYSGRQIGTLDGLTLLPANDSSSSFLLELTASFPNFVQTLDRILAEQGNLGSSCDDQLHWVGGSSVRGASATLDLTSNVRNEKWRCSGSSATRKTSEDTRVIDWWLGVTAARLDDLLVVAQVVDIKGVPTLFQSLLGLRVRKEFKVPLPTECGACDCASVVEILRPELRGIRFRHASNGTMRLAATISVPSNLIGLLECVPWSTD